jgi:hypothetical protein
VFAGLDLRLISSHNGNPLVLNRYGCQKILLFPLMDSRIAAAFSSRHASTIGASPRSSSFCNQRLGLHILLCSSYETLRSSRSGAAVQGILGDLCWRGRGRVS